MKSKERPELNMTMISVFYDANINPLRKTATQKAVECWMKQKSLPKEMMFIELGFNGKFTFSKEDFPNCIQYIRIDGTDKNKYLFQKEHLWNIAAKRAKYEKLMFVDSDIAPLNDVDWFGKVYSTLDRCLFTQGFKKIQYLDSSNKSFDTKSSYTHSFVTMGVTSGVPGGVYCLNRKVLNEINGFNFLPFGGGDDLWWSELLCKDKRPFLVLFRRDNVKQVFTKNLNKSKKLILDVNVNICHFYHGGRNSRSYGERQYILLTQFPWNDRLLTCDKQGLLSWKELNHYFYKVASKIHTVNNDQNQANNLLREHINYIRFKDNMTWILKSDCQVKSKEDIQKGINKNLEQFCIDFSDRPFLKPKNPIKENQVTFNESLRRFWFG